MTQATTIETPQTGLSQGTTPWRQPQERIFLVLPAYNEEANLPALLQSFDAAMSREGFEYQVVVVDDGSKDATFRIATEYAAKMPVRVERHVINQGLGPTIRDGLKLATEMASDNDIIVAMDADNSHSPGLIRSMIQVIREGADVVTASRYQTGSCIRGVPAHRQLMSIGARWLFQIAFPITNVRDYTCGFRAYRVTVLKQAFAHYGEKFINQQGFHCMADILLKLSKLTLVFREVPMILRYDLKGGVSKMRVAKTVMRTLGLMLRRRFGSLD